MKCCIRTPGRRRLAPLVLLLSLSGGSLQAHSAPAPAAAGAPAAAASPDVPPHAQSPTRAWARVADTGPYNATFLAGGIGLAQPLAAESPAIAAGAPWSMSGWLLANAVDPETVSKSGTRAASRGDADAGAIASAGAVSTDASDALIVAALGEPLPTQCRCLTLNRGHLTLQLATATASRAESTLRSNAPLDPTSWHSVVATYDGHTARLYLDGAEVDARDITTAAVSPVLRLAPESLSDLTGAHHFGGSLALFTLHPYALDAADVDKLTAARPDFALIDFHHVGVGWPWQEHAWRGLQEPQPAWTLPHGNAPFTSAASALAQTATTATTPASTAPASHPTAAPGTAPPALQLLSPNRWSLGSWHLTPAPGITASPALLSSPQYREQNWYAAIVPGTVLTTLIANGVYPDPDYGLNNLAIPESLNRQDYWYRTQFLLPPDAARKQLTLTFNGINYAAEIWLNGTRLGSMRGAFIRGTFDVTASAHPGSENVLAIRVSPPPHPGIPHEQSVAAGPGENGGNLAIDGPTFIATEGWDWIPAIRDRNTGIWQDVELTASGTVRLVDPQVVTSLPLPRTDSADLVIHVPVENRAATTAIVSIDAAIGGIHITKQALLSPGLSEIQLTPDEFKELRLAHPRLWWPNGYGAPELYTLALGISVNGVLSDSKRVRFGIREITYELSLFDHNGKLRRVEVDPTAGSARRERLVDVRHEAIKRTANGWAESLTPVGESSPAIRALNTTSLTPYLAIRVNGVRIAARGGSWGMDDSRKRISRERLEPYFRLHREAHLNIIRNWLGQNTEDVFYDLADEYGLLILNDFWESTQNFQVEAEDPQLFLDNARDVIRRYRNHPSIAVWFGRNEGVPQPILNEGLADAVAELDGTRYYTGSSNTVNLQGSGPYNYRPPEQYFTTLAQGFSVEVGTPSLASLESLKASIPEADRWPLGDTYAYHDWHFGGNGDTASFMQALQTGLGAAATLEDFERKAQLLNYVSYRAIFEGFQAGLWTRNSGRLLWMTHPSWPSNAWQIYTSDYDTPAAYYGVAKACEPLHAQLNLPDLRPAVVNVTRDARLSLRLRSRALSLDNRLLLTRVDRVDAPANAVVTLNPLDLTLALAREDVVLVELTLTDTKGVVLSNNIYWQAHGDTDLRRLAALPAQSLVLGASAHIGASTASADSTIHIKLQNHGPSPALLAKVTLLDAAGERVLPAYYSDNYMTLLPGESRDIEAKCPTTGNPCTTVTLRGWNVSPATVAIPRQ